MECPGLQQEPPARMIPMDSGWLVCHVCLGAGSSCLCPLIMVIRASSLTHHAQPLLLTLTDLMPAHGQRRVVRGSL